MRYLRTGIKKNSNEPNELERTHVIGVSFSSYQFVAFLLARLDAMRAEVSVKLTCLCFTKPQINADGRRFDLTWRSKQMS
jgi:hypothetical protein